MLEQTLPASDPTTKTLPVVAAPVYVALRQFCAAHGTSTRHHRCDTQNLQVARFAPAASRKASKKACQMKTTHIFISIYINLLYIEINLFSFSIKTIVWFLGCDYHLHFRNWHIPPWTNPSNQGEMDAAPSSIIFPNSAVSVYLQRENPWISKCIYIWYHM